MKNRKYKRIFLVVMDSLGVGAMADAEKYGDRRTAIVNHRRMYRNSFGQ